MIVEDNIHYGLLTAITKLLKRPAKWIVPPMNRSLDLHKCELVLSQIRWLES